MIYTIFAACALLAVLFIVDVIVAINDRRRSDRGRVYLPSIFAFIGAICGGFFIAFTVWAALSEESPWASFAFLGFVLLCSVVSMTHLNCRVTYDDECFTAKNFWGFKRTFTYTDIMGIRERPSLSDSLLYVGRRRVVVETLAVGGMEFEGHLRKRYRSLHGGRTIPVIKAKHGDPFNGHVEGGVGIIFAYCLMSVVCVGMLTAGVVITWFTPPTPEKSVVTEVVFERVHEQGNTLYLRPADGLKHELRDMDDGIDREAIKTLCDGKTVVTVYGSKQYEGEDGQEPFRVIYALAVRDTYLVDFEDAARLHVRGHWPIVALFASFTLIWGVFVFFSLRVGRNPERYSKRVVHFFFKKGTIRYHS